MKAVSTDNFVCCTVGRANTGRPSSMVSLCACNRVPRWSRRLWGVRRCQRVWRVQRSQVLGCGHVWLREWVVACNHGNSCTQQWLSLCIMCGIPHLSGCCYGMSVYCSNIYIWRLHSMMTHYLHMIRHNKQQVVACIIVHSFAHSVQLMTWQCIFYIVYLIKPDIDGRFSSSCFVMPYKHSIPRV